MIEALYEPIQIGPVRIPNRIFVAPHTTNFGRAEENLITDRHLAYHGARAAGGAGLIITEGIRVHPTSLRRLGLQAYDDASLDGLSRLAEEVHRHDTRLFAQLLHTGRHSGDERQGSWGPTDEPWSTGAAVPHVMNRFDLQTVSHCFGAAARRIRAAGFDGAEVHIGHGHLLQQFLSPVTNTRTDRYGGTLEGRMRLTREVLAEVAEAFDGELALGLRLSADEFLPGGLGPDEMEEIVESLVADFPIQFLHVSHSAYVGAPSLSTQMADMSYSTVPFRDLPARFRQRFAPIPVLAVCRIDDLDHAAALIADGEADLAGFARAHIADPGLAAAGSAALGRAAAGSAALGRAAAGSAALGRAAAGSAEGGSAEGGRGMLRGRVRSCVACNQGCNANLESITPITCTVNPEVGREADWRRAWQTPAEPRRVLVVGAGPAGLEAAATAARRGHAVTLWEREPELGGTIHAVVKRGLRERFGLLISELSDEVAALSSGPGDGPPRSGDGPPRSGDGPPRSGDGPPRPGSVKLSVGVQADVQSVLAGDFECVVVATGATPRAPIQLPGVPTFNVNQAVSDPAALGGVVAIFDELGGWEGVSVAEFLAARGVRVRLISPVAAWAGRVTVYSRLAIGARLAAAGVRISVLRRPVRADADPEGLVLADVLSGEEERVESVDALIHVCAPVARDGLLEGLADAGFTGEIRLIGDAHAPRSCLEAVYEGRLAGVMIGTDDAELAASLGARDPYRLGPRLDVGPGRDAGPGLALREPAHTPTEAAHTPTEAAHTPTEAGVHV